VEGRGAWRWFAKLLLGLESDMEMTHALSPLIFHNCNLLCGILQIGNPVMVVEEHLKGIMRHDAIRANSRALTLIVGMFFVGID
jgi:hypothetical protein